MTEETKRLFNAPWKDSSYVVEDMSYFDVDDMYGQCMVSCHVQYYTSKEKPGIDEDDAEKTKNRILHLPELYDALMYFVVNDCPHAFISNDECRLCPDKKCKTRKAVELLQKVRDVE